MLLFPDPPASPDGRGRDGVAVVLTTHEQQAPGDEPRPGPPERPRAGDVLDQTGDERVTLLSTAQGLGRRA